MLKAIYKNLWNRYLPDKNQKIKAVCDRYNQVIFKKSAVF